MSSTVQKIETKVIAATAGGGAGAAVGQFILWLLAVLFWHANNSAGAAAEAIAQVPGPVATIVTLVVAAIGVFVGGYAAPHTARPDLIDQSSTPASDTNVPVVTTAVKTALQQLADHQSIAVTASGASTPALTNGNDNAGVLPADFDFTSLDQAGDTTSTPTGATS